MTCLAAQQDMSMGTEGTHATGDQEHGDALPSACMPCWIESHCRRVLGVAGHNDPVKIGVYVCVLNVGFNVGLMRPLQHRVWPWPLLWVAPSVDWGMVLWGGSLWGSMLKLDGAKRVSRSRCPASTGVQVGGGAMSLERWVSGFTHYLAVERRVSLHTQHVYERDVRACCRRCPSAAALRSPRC
jgi:hypothetical protein